LFWCPHWSVKVKIKSYLTKYHAMKAYEGMEIELHAFLTSALEGGEWSASRRGRFTPRGNTSRYPMDRRLGGPQSRSERSGEEKGKSLSLPGIEPRSSNITFETLRGVRLSSNVSLRYLHVYQLFPLPNYTCFPKFFAIFRISLALMSNLVGGQLKFISSSCHYMCNATFEHCVR
jgi:hypothetical protein